MHRQYANTAHKRSARCIFLGAAALAFAGVTASRAQDMRQVTEPELPPVCHTLQAQLAGGHGIRPADEQRLDTLRIQQAINHCRAGHAVELAPDGDLNAFLSGPIHLRRGVTLLVDQDVTLFASRDPRLYDRKPGTCGMVTAELGSKRGCKPLIRASRANGSGIMGQGTIDGRGGAKLLIDGQPQPESWWDLAEAARKLGRQEVPRLIETNRTNGFTVYRITLKNSANFHLAFHHGNGLTVWGVTIDTPRSARNTDGIDPSFARNVTIADSYIRTGDDNVALKAYDGRTENVSIVHNHFYSGHGMSIGSETKAGVQNVFVSDLTIDGADNGLRIKSNPGRGGMVREVLYNDVCIRNVKSPIVMDTAYQDQDEAGGHPPVYQDIVLHKVRVWGGGRIQLVGLDATHRVGIQLDGVLLNGDPSQYRLAARHSDITLGPGPVNFKPVGEDSTVTGLRGIATVGSCSGRFVAFPGDAPEPSRPRSTQPAEERLIASSADPRAGSGPSGELDTPAASTTAEVPSAILTPIRVEVTVSAARQETVEGQAVLPTPQAVAALNGGSSAPTAGPTALPPAPSTDPSTAPSPEALAAGASRPSAISADSLNEEAQPVHRVSSRRRARHKGHGITLRRTHRTTSVSTERRASSRRRASRRRATVLVSMR